MYGIMGMVGLALRTELTTQQREFLEMASSSADALLRIVNDILDFSKIEAHKFELDHAPFKLRESLGDTLKLLSGQVHDKALELIFRVDPATPDNLIGDSGRLNQIIINLLNNAIKFTSKGEIVLQVKQESSMNDRVCLLISVSDTGIGIPPEKQQLIFDAFAQIDASSTRQFGGTGLGLSISSRLVELMGGRIWLESEVGKGSTFFFTVCFDLHTNYEPDTAPAPFIDVKGLPVLVVDDNPINLRVFDEILHHWGMIPTLVDNGEAAIKALQAKSEAGQTFSLILLDAMMPTMDGFMVAQLIRADHRIKPTTVMMLSSADRPDDFERCRKLGIDLYVRKPVKHSELWSAIQSALGKAAASTDHKVVADLQPCQALKILLAEDNPVNRHMAVVLLEERGHTVDVANDGQEVLDLLARADFDLILMDIQMPIMDGFQATKAIREKELGTDNHIRIIAMTAHALKGDKERCLAAGMDGYIAKPVKEEELLRTVENCRGIEEKKNPVESTPESETIAPLLNWQEALDRVRGRQKLLFKMIELFQEQAPTLISEINEALLKQDADQLRRSAHTLKSSANSIGAFAMAEIAEMLELNGQHADFIEADKNYSVLYKANNDLEPVIQRYLADSKEIE
ncbi:MAG: response regulator [Methylococcaceae bacterium]|nr:response regulator [Methylococcaceae bacterium]